MPSIFDRPHTPTTPSVTGPPRAAGYPYGFVGGVLPPGSRVVPQPAVPLQGREEVTFPTPTEFVTGLAEEILLPGADPASQAFFLNNRFMLSGRSEEEEDDYIDAFLALVKSTPDPVRQIGQLAIDRFKSEF